MRRIVMASLLSLLVGGTACAETFTGTITSEFQGGASYQHIQVDGKWYMVGCGPDSDLSDGLRAYLEERWNQQGSVTGELRDDPQWGQCIASPELAKEATQTFWEKNPWLRLDGEVDDKDRQLVETVLTGVYWDPVYSVPAKSWLGFCRYFHDRGFLVKVKHEYKPWDVPEDGEEGHHEVVITFSRPQDDMGVLVPIVSVFDLPALQNKLRAKARGQTFDSVFRFKDAMQTERYSAGEWHSVSQADWLVISGAVIKNGYVEEAQ